MEDYLLHMSLFLFGPEFIKHFSCLTHLSTKFILLISVTTIVYWHDKYNI